MESQQDQQDELASFYTLRGRSLQMRQSQGGDPAGQGGPTFSHRKSQPCQSALAQSSTHMGEGESAERCLIAFVLHLLHQRADHQLGIQAWKPSTGQAK